MSDKQKGRTFKEIFYNEIINEAKDGCVDCGYQFNIFFSSSVLEKGKLNFLTKAEDNNKYLVPNLQIKNKKLFDLYLEKYFLLAKDFYKDQYYCDIDCEKAILANVWANAISEDFANPIIFLKKRIAFLEDKTFSKYHNPVNLGHSDILDGDIIVHMQKDGFLQETPYFLEIRVEKEEDSYVLPEVKLAFMDNKAYIFGLQRDKKKIKHNKYSKKVNRALYKVNKNFKDEEKDEYLNMKNITPSSLVALNITLSLLNKEGIKDVVAPAFLPMRWNAKKLAYEKRMSYLKTRGLFCEEAKEEFDDERLRIQKNLSDKFIRTFRRLEYHVKGIDIKAYPFEIDEHLHVRISENLEHNNPLLYETSIYNKDNKKLLLKKEC